jgi:cytochrome b561
MTVSLAHLHWSMAALIVLAFGLGLLIDEFPKTWKYAMIEGHKVIGISILILLAARIVWRLGHRPPTSEELSPIIARAAQIGHFALYVLMFATPAIGLGYAVLRGQGFDFGLFAIPPLAAASPREITRPLRQFHEWAAYGLLGLALLHALVALWHHFVARDGVMRRMLPAR